jgi:hypothetical protein
MKHKIKPDTWIWVIVQNPETNEQFFGQMDEQTNESFIPAFYQKEDAQQCLLHLTAEKGTKYEVQAIALEELVKDAAQNNFMIFMLDADGKILKKIKL